MTIKWVKCCVAALLVSVLTACAAVEPPRNDEPFAMLTVAVRSGERNQLQNIAAAFEKENPNIKLKFIELSGGTEQYRLISAAFSTGEYLFDVVEVEDVWMDDLIAKGYIQPLPEHIQPGADCIPYVKDSFDREGKTYAMPFQMDVGMLFALKKYGWDGEFSSITQLASDMEVDMRIRDDDWEEMVCCMMELIRYTDNDIYEALELYREIYHSENGGRQYVAAFKKGDLPVLRASSSIIPALRDETSSVAGEFQIYNTPRSGSEQETTTAKIFGFAASKLTEQSENCMKFIEYCGRSDVQREWCVKTGVYPVKQSLYNDPSITSEWSHISPMTQRILQAQIRPHREGYIERSNSIRDQISAYLAGELSTGETASYVKTFFAMEK